MRPRPPRPAKDAGARPRATRIAAVMLAKHRMPEIRDGARPDVGAIQTTQWRAGPAADPTTRAPAAPGSDPITAARATATAPALRNATRIVRLLSEEGCELSVSVHRVG